MASVNITQTAGALYTWDTAGFTFDDVEGTKTFDGASVTMFGLDVAEDVVGASDSLKRTFTKSRSETVAFAEVDHKQISMAIDQALGVSSQFERQVQFSRAFAETVAVAEQIAKTFGLNNPESFAIAEKLRQTFGKNSAESVLFSEQYTDSIAFMRAFAESINFAEIGGKDVTKPFSRSIGIAEKLRKTFGKHPMRSLAISESLYRRVDFSRNLLEPIRIAEIAGKNFTRPLSDSFGVTDHGHRDFSKNAVRSLVVSEWLMRSVEFNTRFFETVRLVDRISKNYSLRRFETLNLIEEWRRKGGAIISAVVIESEAIDISGFRNYLDLGVVPGYSPFKPFIPGDYTYKDALFKIVMQSNTNDRARVDGLRVDIDVPDVIDRGTATITDAAAGVTVIFDREFLEEPEITVTLRGSATVGIPRVTTKSNTQFTLHLLNNAGGFTTGTVGWTAQGY